MLQFAIPCLLGLESLVGDEVKKLGLADVRVENGRVLCRGEERDLARLNINLRCGARVLLVLASFRATDFETLFQGTRAVRWEDWVPREGEFPVTGYSINSTLHSVPACQSIVKKASAKRLGEKYGVETLPESGSRYQIQFSIIKDVATLYLDTSGEGLYKRGYRAKNMGAPLRETLAAALVTLSATPSAAAAPSPSRRPSLPRTGHRAWTAALPLRSGKTWTPSCGWRPVTRPWIRNSTAIMTSGAAILTLPLWSWRGTTRSWPVWRTASVLKWQTRENSTGTANTASW